jgi:prevent-host-death family protein
MEDRHMSVAEVKRRFSDVMAEVIYTGRRIVVERRGRPMVAIVPLESETDTRSPGEQLAEVIGFGEEQAEEFHEIMKEVIAQRHERMPRPLPEDVP